MTSTTADHGTLLPPAQFVSLAVLLGPSGLITRALDPTPSRRALIRRLRAAGIPRWKCNGPYAPGRGEIYFDQAEVAAWLERNKSVPRQDGDELSDGVKQHAEPANGPSRVPGLAVQSSKVPGFTCTEGPSSSF